MPGLTDSTTAETYPAGREGCEATTCRTSAMSNLDEADVPLDFAQLTRRCMGKIEFAERLLASFDQRFPQELSQIEQCLVEGDAARLARQAHQLRGAAANVSAPGLQAVLGEMEESARAAQLNDVASRLPDVRRAWRRYQEYKSSLPSRAASSAADRRI